MLTRGEMGIVRTQNRLVASVFRQIHKIMHNSNWLTYSPAFMRPAETRSAGFFRCMLTVHVNGAY